MNHDLMTVITDYETFCFVAVLLSLIAFAVAGFLGGIVFEKERKK